jgi:hypothetical protein
MRDVARVAAVRDDRSRTAEPLDLEAETRHRINMLVARTNAWRSGSIQAPADAEPAIEAAAS